LAGGEWRVTCGSEEEEGTCFGFHEQISEVRIEDLSPFDKSAGSGDQILPERIRAEREGILLWGWESYSARFHPDEFGYNQL
jgi:hypothetical protein